MTIKESNKSNLRYIVFICICLFIAVAVPVFIDVVILNDMVISRLDIKMVKCLIYTYIVIIFIYNYNKHARLLKGLVLICLLSSIAMFMYYTVAYVNIYNDRKQDTIDMIIASQNILDKTIDKSNKIENDVRNVTSISIFQFCKTGSLRLSYVVPIYISSVISPDSALDNKDINEFINSSFSQRMFSIDTIIDLHKSEEFNSIKETNIYKFSIDIINSTVYYSKSISFLILIVILSAVLICCGIFDKRRTKRKFNWFNMK